MASTVKPQRDPAEYRRKKAQRARELFASQRKEALDAAEARRVDAIAKAQNGDPDTPVWAQVRQCYMEHRPAQVKFERGMRRCSGGSVSPVFTGRQTCLALGAQDRLADAA